MNREDFTDLSPGELIPISFPRKDWAFLPQRLPPNWEMELEVDNYLWPLLAEAREALGTLNGIGQTLPDPNLLLRPLQSREAIASSSIEGTYVTPKELLLFEIDPSEPVTRSEKKADWQEVLNYNRALRSGSDLLQVTGFCDHLIRSIHQELMHGVRGRDKSPGEYRRKQVQLGSSGRFIPPPHEHVQGLMDNLHDYVQSENTRIDRLVKSFIVHYQFETIHPFEDGNGRVGRTLLALMISRWHNHAHPWLYLSAFFEEYRDEYMQNLYRVSTEGAWGLWIEFCLRGTISQANDSIARCLKFRELKEQFHQKVSKVNRRTYALIESLFVNPIITISELARRNDVAYRTARRDLEQLVKDGILTEVLSEHPRFYFCGEIMRAAYDWEYQPNR